MSIRYQFAVLFALSVCVGVYTSKFLSVDDASQFLAVFSNVVTLVMFASPLIGLVRLQFVLVYFVSCFDSFFSVSCFGITYVSPEVAISMFLFLFHFAPATGLNLEEQRRLFNFIRLGIHVARLLFELAGLWLPYQQLFCHAAEFVWRAHVDCAAFILVLFSWSQSAHQHIWAW